MGDKRTVMEARQELEELYGGIPDESVDLTFKDFASMQLAEPEEKKVISMVPIHELHQEVTQQDQVMKKKKKKIISAEQRAHLGGEEEKEEEEEEEEQKQGGGRRKARPGIPHTNLCSLCNRYIHFFRHRCLVCGRVYCRNCVPVGMGTMTEGRKCLDCLGRRFSQKYIQRAGNSTGSCWTYPSSVKQQELIWAEKGPRRSGKGEPH
ncbi:putative Zinc finger, FYVE/PHD-type, Zinc finger, RING/FYVE/PHD-type [Dioscorea sansibarensis]